MTTVAPFMSAVIELSWSNLKSGREIVRTSERQRASGQTRPAWPGNA